MKDLLEFMYTNWTHCVFSMLILLVLWIAFIAGIRVLIETSIPLAFEKIIKNWFTVQLSIKKVQDQLK